MKSAKQLSLVAFAVVALAASVRAQGIQYDKIEIKTEKIAPNLYMLSGSENVDPGHPDGAGGRIGVLAGPDGIFMVDAQYVQIGGDIILAVQAKVQQMIAQGKTQQEVLGMVYSQLKGGN
jgi:hypothetical protein